MEEELTKVLRWFFGLGFKSCLGGVHPDKVDEAFDGMLEIVEERNHWDLTKLNRIVKKNW